MPTTPSARSGVRACRAFLARPSWEVAPELLGWELAFGGVAGRIVEVEAYAGVDDPASHAFRGPTARTEAMFGPAGFLYVYFSYGMHWCANVVTGARGEGSAVLLRALAPTVGRDAMRARRPVARTDAGLCSGPAKLCQALAIDKAQDGADLLGRGDGPSLRACASVEPLTVVATTRVGISVATDRPWRWYVAGDPNVSRPR